MPPGILDQQTLKLEISADGDLKVLGGVRAFLMSTSSFADLMDDFYLVLGERFVNARMYMGGRRAGLRTAPALASMFGIAPSDKAQLEKIFSDLDCSIGWGRYEFHLDYAAGKGIVLVHHSFLAEGALSKFTANGKISAIQARDSFPRCALLAGYLAGLCSFLLERDVDMQETECRALGHSACKFEILDHRIHVSSANQS
ncbi:MAG: 4-vinyl reductase [Anaerolineae bacterium]|nr:4-vinyl reductase [Anaerolineae bacterium]